MQISFYGTSLDVIIQLGNHVYLIIVTNQFGCMLAFMVPTYFFFFQLVSDVNFRISHKLVWVQVRFLGTIFGRLKNDRDPQGVLMFRLVSQLFR